MTNIEMLRIVAKALGELKNDVVFVGGATAELYADNPDLSDIRPTIDIDCIIELSSRVKYAKLEEQLSAKGFLNDMSKDAPICRWLYKGIKVDVMPTDENILGFSNQWYVSGIANKISKTLFDGTSIYILAPEYYLATKIEAHNSRGGNDLRQSHDFEDIIYIVDNCSNIINNVKEANTDLKLYVKQEFEEFLKNSDLAEGIESALPTWALDEEIDAIKQRFVDLANLLL